MKVLYRREQLDVRFGERERKIHRDPAGNRTWDLLITRQALLPLSHWTHGKSAYNSHAKGLSRLQLSFSLSPLGLRGSHIGYKPPKAIVLVLTYS